LLPGRELSPVAPIERNPAARLCCRARPCDPTCAEQRRAGYHCDHRRPAHGHGSDASHLPARLGKAEHEHRATKRITELKIPTSRDRDELLSVELEHRRSSVDAGAAMELP